MSSKKTMKKDINLWVCMLLLVAFVITSPIISRYIRQIFARVFDIPDWGSYLGGIYCGLLSAFGVFFTLQYYTNKDAIADEQLRVDNEKRTLIEIQREKEEKDWRDNSRILGIKPYLRIIKFEQSYEKKYKTVSVTFDNGEKFVPIDFPEGRFVISNDGLGVALHIECSEATGFLDISETNNLSLSVGEKFVLELKLFSKEPIKSTIFLKFYFYDMFDNKYEQVMSAIVGEHNKTIECGNIFSPKIVKNA